MVSAKRSRLPQVLQWAEREHTDAIGQGVAVRRPNLYVSDCAKRSRNANKREREQEQAKLESFRVILVVKLGLFDCLVR